MIRLRPTTGDRVAMLAGVGLFVLAVRDWLRR